MSIRSCLVCRKLQVRFISGLLSGRGFVGLLLFVCLFKACLTVTQAGEGKTPGTAAGGCGGGDGRGG